MITTDQVLTMEPHPSSEIYVFTLPADGDDPGAVGDLIQITISADGERVTRNGAEILPGGEHTELVLMLLETIDPLEVSR